MVSISRNLQVIRMILILGCTVLLQEGQESEFKLWIKNKNHVRKHGKMIILKWKILKNYISIMSTMKTKRKKNKLTSFSEAMKWIKFYSLSKMNNCKKRWKKCRKVKTVIINDKNYFKIIVYLFINKLLLILSKNLFALNYQNILNQIKIVINKMEPNIQSKANQMFWTKTYLTYILESIRFIKSSKIRHNSVFSQSTSISWS